MAVKDFLAPTRGRILIFLVLFIAIFVYDTAFTPFPGSPVVDNLATQDGATSFLLYILILPYILSCLLPAFMGLRKRKFFRVANLAEFMQPRSGHFEHKETQQKTFNFPAGTETMQSHINMPQDSLDVVEASTQPATPNQNLKAQVLGTPSQAKPQTSPQSYIKPATGSPKPNASKPVAKVAKKSVKKTASRKPVAKKKVNRKSSNTVRASTRKKPVTIKVGNKKK